MRFPAGETSRALALRAQALALRALWAWLVSKSNGTCKSNYPVTFFTGLVCWNCYCQDIMCLPVTVPSLKDNLWREINNERKISYFQVVCSTYSSSEVLLHCMYGPDVAGVVGEARGMNSWCFGYIQVIHVSVYWHSKAKSSSSLMSQMAGLPWFQ